MRWLDEVLEMDPLSKLSELSWHGGHGLLKVAAFLRALKALLFRVTFYFLIFF